MLGNSHAEVAARHMLRGGHDVPQRPPDTAHRRREQYQEDKQHHDGPEQARGLEGVFAERLSEQREEAIRAERQYDGEERGYSNQKEVASRSPMSM